MILSLLRGEKPLAQESQESLALEEKIEEHKAFLRHFQRLMGPEWLEHAGGVATIDRQLIMIDALVITARAQLRRNYNAGTLTTFLLAIFTAVRDDRVTTNPGVLAVEAEYLRQGGSGLNERHSVVLFTTGNFYEHISGRGLASACRESGPLIRFLVHS